MFCVKVKNAQVLVSFDAQQAGDASQNVGCAMRITIVKTDQTRTRLNATNGLVGQHCNMRQTLPLWNI